MADFPPAYSVEKFKSEVSKMKGFASPSLYVVQISPPALSYSKLPRGDSREINILCRGTEIPGRQIDTVNRQHGVLNTKVVNGRSVTEVNLQFHLTNDYVIRNYFEAWQDDMISNEPPYNAKYYQDYVREVKILQLRKGESFPIFNTDLGFDLDLPPEIKNRLPTIDPKRIFGGVGLGGVDIGDISSGKLNVALFTQENVVYECTLQNAFPTTISPIALANEGDGISAMSVSLTYKNWISNFTVSNIERTIDDFVGDTVNKVIGAVVGTFVN